MAQRQGIEVGVPGCHIVRKIEERREIHVTRLRKRMQWSKPLLALGCNIGAMLDQESCKTYMDPVGCTMEWHLPSISLDCHTSPVLDKARSR